MQQLQIKNIRKIKKAIPTLEKKLKIRISLQKESVTLKGDEVKIFTSGKIIQAIDFGFDIDNALLLSKDTFCLEFINIKEHTHRRNLKEVRSRVIGRDGKAKKAIEELTGGAVVIQANLIGLIVDAEHLDSATQGIISLIQGAKHGNVFTYLEKQNTKLKTIKEEDLGLR